MIIDYGSDIALGRANELQMDKSLPQRTHSELWEDLRSYLNLLEEQGDLVLIKKPVKTKHEVAAYIRKTSDVEGPAFLFSHIEGYPGWRFAAGLFSAKRRIAGILNHPIPECWRSLRDAIDAPISPRTVSNGSCKDAIWQGDDVDLYKIPIPWHSEKDAGPYIVAAVDFTHDPDDDSRLVGIHRMQLKGKDRLSFQAGGQRSARKAFVKCEEKNKGLQIAVAIGVDPRIEVASQAKIPHGTDKVAIAGRIKGSPIEMIKCETIEVEVPASSEIVIEGELLPGIREEEGPFGEFNGAYGNKTSSPILKVKAITMRQDPIYVTTLAGVPVTENNLLTWPAMCEVVYRRASMCGGEVSGVNVTGNCLYTAVVSIKKRMQREPYNIISTILGSISQTKYCIIVDDDIDVNKPTDIEWALETRVQPNEDVYVFPVMMGGPLDPSAPIPSHTSKMGIDATIPLNAPKERFEKIRIPGVERVAW